MDTFVTKFAMPAEPIAVGDMIEFECDIAVGDMIEFECDILLAPETPQPRLSVKLMQGERVVREFADYRPLRRGEPWPRTRLKSRTRKALAVRMVRGSASGSGFTLSVT